ncbi:MAG: choice-of-anchor D domain-containing protein [Kofleriaceae bacterium]|nr:choice-of-anchor D domain-containing protein [Myxococcales bacterium]MCB9561008.1 choice-of-anchor D domain-containing protein [Kofleriaceae bacterium]MCB9574514.1 choice-of-anchor D domain-containing protein [Kofleriaceae bacterium]
MSVSGNVTRACSVVALAAATLLTPACFDPPKDVKDIDATVGPTIDAGPDAMIAPAMLSTAQQPHDFGDVTVDAASALLSVVVRNVGGERSGALGVALTGDQPGDFELVPTGGADDCFGAVLDPEETCLAQVRFVPSQAGARAASLDVSGDPGGTVSVALSGNGLTAGALAFVGDTSLAFGTVEIGAQSATQSLTVENTGGSTTAALTVTLGDATSYTKTSDTCDGQPLGGGSQCVVTVRFNPSAVGAAPTSVSVRESPTVGVSGAISGTGSARVQVTAVTHGKITSMPAGLDCGATCGPVSFTQTPITLTATADTGYELDAWTGDCAGTVSSVCSLTLDQALTTAGATFRQLDCVPNTVVCDDTTGHYVDCSGTGTIDFEMQCPLGCSPTSEQCLDVDPSNGLATYLDMAPSGPDVAFAGSSTINTTTGTVFNGAQSVTVPTALVAQTGGPSIRVLMFNSLSVAGTLKVTGTYPLALVVNGDVSITGTLDVSADASIPGPGGQESQSGDGGCHGSGRTSGSSNPSPGGGGGGGRNLGAAGGTAGDGTTTSGGGAMGGGLIPLQAGCAGGATIEDPPLRISYGGGGGGAVQIVSRTQIAVTGSGKIDASGGGGESRSFGTSTTAAIGGGGGGGGGGVLLEAPQLSLDGAGVVISAKGGSGAAAGTGSAGHQGKDGGTAAGAVTGGSNAGLASGGAGGTETVLPTAGGNGSGATDDGGGGGGSVGYARFKSQGGGINPQNGAAIRAYSTAGAIGSRLVP